jgi:hypothetical protein
MLLYYLDLILGLIMEIFTGSTTNRDNYTMEKGIALAVHERGQMPIMKYDALKVGTSQAASVSVTRMNFSKLGKPYTNCRTDLSQKTSSDTVYYNMTFDMSKYYQRLCIGVYFSSDASTNG